MLPPEVVSTGLRYLILPVRGRALERARIARPDLEARLAALGAQFAYLFEATDLEGSLSGHAALDNDFLREEAFGDAPDVTATPVARPPVCRRPAANPCIWR